MPSESTLPPSLPSRMEVGGTPNPIRVLFRTTGLGWLCLAFVLYFCQTLPHLSYRWVTDESWYAAPGYSFALGHGIANPAIGPNDFENHFDTRSPGTAIVIGTAFRLFGVGAIQARLGSVLAGLIIIFATYRLSYDVIGKQGALIATFLIATDNLLAVTSRAARPECLTAMAVMVSFLAIKQYASNRGLFGVLLSGFLIGLGSMFHVMLLGYIISFGILIIVIDRRFGSFPLRGALTYSFGYALGLVPFAWWILSSPVGRAAFHDEYLNRAVGMSMWARILGEEHRYSDFLGFNILHGHGLDFVPVRLLIPLVFIAATFLLWKLRRQWFYLEMLLLTPTVLWFIYLTTVKSSRYLVLLAPVFALAIGAAVAATQPNRKLHRIMLGLAGLVVVMQIAANFFFLHSSRSADYNKVTAELNSVIPPGQAAYGTVTFWLALHDHPFISYERTDLWMAANQYHVRYFIAGDRVMTNGFLTPDSSHGPLQETMAEMIAQSQLVGQFPDPYYGDLKVYELRQH